MPSLRILLGLWQTPNLALSVVNQSKRTKAAITWAANLANISFVGCVWVPGQITVVRLVVITNATSMKIRKRTLM